MKKLEGADKPDKEITAISVVFNALNSLDAPAQRRVIDYVEKKLDLKRTSDEALPPDPDLTEQPGSTERAATSNIENPNEGGSEEFDGISPVAQKWMRRNGLTAKQLSMIFSLGVDEIDLVANAIPGKNKKERMRSLCLLKGVSAYLGSGVARFAHQQLKETCLHYDAYDSANFATHLKDFAAEVSGSKESGYTLTARGITNATGMLKKMTDASKED